MKASEWIMVCAVLLGPVFAIQISQLLEKKREDRQRKLAIFKTLMTTRASRLAPEHIQALNTIDIEFYGSDRKSKDVIDAWKAYLDHLANFDSLPPDAWAPRSTDLFIEMLYRMALKLGYEFDKVSLKRTSYIPKWYQDIEDDQLKIRKGLAAVFSGEDAFPIQFIPPEQSEDEKHESATRQKRETELQEKLADSLSGKTPMKIVLVSEKENNR